MGPAIFKHGEYRAVGYTPSADTTAGSVIVLNDCVRIAHRDIPANTLGALSAGMGVYDINKAVGTGSGTGTTAIADGKLLYWDATNNVVTATASGNKQIGYAVGASLDTDTVQRVFHWPA